jgi:Ni/Co efflux regulator RcnB
MNKLVSVILCVAVVFAPLSVRAGEIQNRLERQERRIHQGIHNGSISPKEARNLKRQEASIRAERARDIRSGGKFTRSEKRHLKHRLDRASRNIYRAKHN